LEAHIGSKAEAFVRKDDHGVWRVGDSRVSLDSVVIAFDQGRPAEVIRQQYPALTLEQVYGAITYYLGHRAEVQAYLSKQKADWDEMRRQADLNPTVERLKAARNTPNPAQS
jgi:uncharacterized protein (DUF433 family)